MRIDEISPPLSKEAVNCISSEIYFDKISIKFRTSKHIKFLLELASKYLTSTSYGIITETLIVDLISDSQETQM